MAGGELVGSVVPRVFTPPLREVWPRSPAAERHTVGWQVVDFARDVLGVELLGWQQWLLAHMLEVDSGRLRFRTIVVLAARQNGKSVLSVVLSLFFVFVRRVPLVIGTAQNLNMAEEIWSDAVTMAESSPELAPLIGRVVRVNGKKALEAVTGERYRVIAANRKAGRGLSADLLLLDELREHKSWDAWGAIVKTTMARPEAVTVCLSNAGDAESVVLRHLRNQAHAALGNPDRLVDLMGSSPGGGDDAAGLGLFEWSARPGREVSDRDGWCEANPAAGQTITAQSLAAAAATDPEWVFRTEVLCQWADGVLVGKFPPGAWEACRTDVPFDGDPLAVAVDVSWDRSWTHIAMAGRWPDGRIHVEVMASEAGTGWVRPWLFERGFRRVVCQRGAPVASLVDEFTELAPDGEPWVDVVDWSGAAIGAACGAFHDLVARRQVTHLDQPVLDVAAGSAATRPLGDSWAWDRKRSPHDAAPLVAVTGAVWGLSQPVEVPPEPALLIL